MSNLEVRAFSAGELAPALYARTDQARYEIGLRTCRNFVVMRQGGATKRPGTEYIAAVKDSTAKTRLLPFVFNVQTANTFVLEFGHHYVRFIQSGAQVVSGMAPLEIVSPYATADLPDLQYVQSADVITIVHPSYPPYELKRLSNTSWTLTAITFGSSTAAPSGVVANFGDLAHASDTDYVVTAVGVNGEESIASNIATAPGPPTTSFPCTVSLTLDPALTPTYNVYRRVNGGGVFGFVGSGITPGGGTIIYFDFGAVPESTLQPPIPATLFASTDNYPSVVAYYQQRLLFANSNTNPDTVWASRTGYYHNFNTSAITQDDDAITFRMVAGRVNAVRHLLDLSRLVIGTEGGASIVEGDGNGTLTPIAINPRGVSYGGMGALKPVFSGANFLYVQALGSSVRELQSSVTPYGSVSFAGGDVTIFSSHLVDGFSITDWAFQEEPMHVVWAVRSDGVLLGLTYIPEQQVLAWHRHDTQGWVESVCVVPEGRTHWVYVVVKRLIGGAYVRYIERMATTNVTPLFATPEEAATAPGGIVTPPPPPPPPPPSTGPVSPPTNGSTTDIGTTGATANWIAGNLLAPTVIEVHPVSDVSGLLWVSTTISGGLQSVVFTALTAGTAYEWRAHHDLSGTISNTLGPIPFTTLAVTAALTAPVSAPSIIDTLHGSGFSDVTISWPASTEGADSDVEYSGPSTLEPDDTAFVPLGAFGPLVTSAVHRIEHTGTYWLRVRYEKPGFDPSAWAGPGSWSVGVVDEV